MKEEVIIGLVAGLVFALFLSLFIVSEIITRRRKKKEKQVQTDREKEAAENAQKKKHEIRSGYHAHDVNAMANIVHEYAQ